MTGAPYFPKADNTIQNFTGNFTGTLQRPNVFVIHSTEGGDWPAYNLGGTPGDSAPNMTYKPQSRLFRGHYPANRSSRALRNEPGGVETNTLNVFQLEIIGTCDPPAKGKYRDAQGRAAAFVPDLSDECLGDLAELLAWLNTEWDVPLTGLPAARWKPYPSSYGTGNGTRMTGAQWSAFKGVCGHQHVPENVHGDPGNFPIATLLAKAIALTKPEEPPVDPPEHETLLQAWDGSTSHSRHAEDAAIADGEAFVAAQPNRHVLAAVLARQKARAVQAAADRAIVHDAAIP